MAIDLNALWDFSDPDLSEQRFRDALATASGDDGLILQTQIARTYGLRRNFVHAREMLLSIERQVRTAGAEAQTRYALELGRTFSSAAHTAESQTLEARDRARSAYLHAVTLAKAEQLDHLAIDALHMLAFVDTEPSDQLKWGREALSIAESSSQPAAKRWEPSLRNNIGYALHQLGRYKEALIEFERAAGLREKQGNASATRIAWWMVARTLRMLDRLDEALVIQRRLERENNQAGTPDLHVFEELEALYGAKGEPAMAAGYADKRNALSKQR
ncbi:MAG: tetratricopeptide repeat protein [Burkholderiaceae bacterium]